MEHTFTQKIADILASFYGNASKDIFEKSSLLQYINLKTRSADRGSKSRDSFGNLYAIYVLVEDYIAHGFHESGLYADYKGAIFSKLLTRQRELPFGRKLQNHALNHRLNEEYKRYFPTSEYAPILRDAETQRYWINENLLKIPVSNQTYNLAEAVVRIIDEYVNAKVAAFDLFIKTCSELESISDQEPGEIEKFITELLAPNVDARLFEVVSYAILKYYYYNQLIYIGFEVEKLSRENLRLYKTGRTNANDGGIDYVMRPLGRFFQVTETLDVKKYFLDIDKIEKYPLTFVIKSPELVEDLYKKLAAGAQKQYPIRAIVDNYMRSIEEVINIPILQQRFKEAVKQGYLKAILDEIIRQSKVEFNYAVDAVEEEQVDEPV